LSGKRPELPESSFNLTVSAKQQAEREAVELPYAHRGRTAKTIFTAKDYQEQASQSLATTAQREGDGDEDDDAPATTSDGDDV